MRIIGRIALILVVLYVAFLGYIYAIMRLPPERFASHMAKMPMIAMMAFPFETFWSSARGGSLQVGDPAPDFELQSVDKTSTVRLSSFRGERPVVLVFGSYT